MTVGEKIQKHRKDLGLSQEELGQQLLVSRQTISLWEKDQTLPTIDNLIRLREIFDISVDDILGFENNQNIETKPNETYCFNFSKDELNQIQRLQKKFVYKRPAIFVLICVLLIISSITFSAPSITIGFAFGMFLIGMVLHIKTIRAFNNSWSKNIERICQSTYEYNVFEDYFIVNIYRDNEKMREFKCRFSDIERIEKLDKWLFLQFGGQLFIIRTNDLKENSAFFSHIDKNSTKFVKKTPSNVWRTISIILFVTSILSIFGALSSVMSASNANNMFEENMWLFFLFTPIPISSIIFGIILKSKGYKYKKNIIVGIIMTVLLCIYGSFTFMFADSYDYSDEPIINVEQTIGIDIPDHKQIRTTNWTDTQSVSRGYIYYTSYIYFDESAVQEFEKHLPTNAKWLSTIPNDLIGIASPLNDYASCDYILIYNKDTAECNTLPDSSGTFRFVNILYNAERNQMEIIEYAIDYTK